MGAYSHTDLEWTLLPSNDLGIANLAAREIVSNRLRTRHNVQHLQMMTMDIDNLNDESSFESSFDHDVDKEGGVDDILSLSSDDDSDTDIPLFDSVRAYRTRSEHNNNTFHWKRVSNINDGAQFTGCVEIAVNNWKRDCFLDSFEAVFTSLPCSSYVLKELCNAACTEVEHFICREIQYRNKRRKSNTRLPTMWVFKVIQCNKGSNFIEGYSQFSIYGNIFHELS